MERRSKSVAENILAAMSQRNITAETLSVATDIQVPDLNDRLEGRVSFMAQELLDVGGFLRFPPESFLRGAA